MMRKEKKKTRDVSTVIDTRLFLLILLSKCLDSLGDSRLYGVYRVN